MRVRILAFAAILTPSLCFTANDTLLARELPADSPATLAPCTEEAIDDGSVHCGTLEVWENRTTRSGRRIPVRFVLLDATGDRPHSSPLVFVAGGPGLAVTSFAPFVATHPMRDRFDILLVDQRGTGGSNPLHCDLDGSDEDLQGYLSGAFPPADIFVRCREKLAATADLAHYSSVDAAHDLDDVRAALGYEQLNLSGGSYGTRASLAYMRAFPTRVRTATLNGVAPISFENPLFHARGAQRAFDMIAAECRSDTACFDAFGDPQEDFDAIAVRLRKGPVAITISHPTTGDDVALHLDEGTFYEGMRTFTYRTEGSRRLPLVLDRAAKGELAPLLLAALQSTRGIQEILHWGMLLSVTCAEDVDRIDEQEIVRETANTFLGDQRVRQQKAACEGWPRSSLPSDWARDVDVPVPTLLLSGTLDPVTPPAFGELAARHLPRSLHIVAPGAHGVDGPCIESITERFLETASIDGLDTSCIADLELPPFAMQ